MQEDFFLLGTISQNKNKIEIVLELHSRTNFSKKLQLLLQTFDFLKKPVSKQVQVFRVSDLVLYIEFQKMIQNLSRQYLWSHVMYNSIAAERITWQTLGCPTNQFQLQFTSNEYVRSLQKLLVNSFIIMTRLSLQKMSTNGKIILHCCCF